MDESEIISTAMWITHFTSIMAAMLLFGNSLFPFYTGVRGWPLRWARLAPFIFATILIVGVAASTCLLIFDVTGDFANLVRPSELNRFFLETAFGPIWFTRLLLSLLLFIVVLRIAVSTLPKRIYKSEIGILILSAGIIATFAAAGHASSSFLQPLLAISSESIHLLAASAWLGGLPPLLFFLARASYDKGEEASAIITLDWFSFMGQWAVAVILIGGMSTLAALILAWNVNLNDFSQSGYGLALFAKLTLFVIMLGIASANRFVLMPRLQKQATGLLLFRRMVLTECILGALLIGAATIMSHMEPPMGQNHGSYEHVH